MENHEIVRRYLFKRLSKTASIEEMRVFVNKEFNAGVERYTPIAEAKRMIVDAVMKSGVIRGEILAEELGIGSTNT